MTSTAWIAMICARWSRERQLICLTIEHPMLDETLRYVNRSEVAVTVEGHVFQPGPFLITLPNDSEQVPNAKLRAFNVERTLGFTLKNLREPPTCKLWLVLASSPEIIEFAFEGYELAPITVNGSILEASLTQDDYSNQPYPRQRITPSLVPGWFT